MWQSLRTMRHQPPGRAARGNRRDTFNGAVEQAEQLFTAAEATDPAARPILIFYGLSQLGRAIAAVSTKLSNDEYKLSGHGLDHGPLDGATQQGLANLLVWGRTRGAFPVVARALGADALDHRCRLGDIWALIPDANRFPLPGSGAATWDSATCCLTQALVSMPRSPCVPQTEGPVSSWFPAGAPCEADSQRDAVFPGTLTITTDSPGFTADLDVNITSSTPVFGASTLNLGVAYNNGPKCSDLNGESPDQLPLVPDLSHTAHWGPVRLEFVAHGVYSPSAPLGDQGVLRDNTPTLLAYEGQPIDGKQYKVTSTTAESLSPLPGVRLPLDQLL